MAGKMDFDIWFTEQFGATPQPGELLGLIARQRRLAVELAETEAKVAHLTAIQQAYTAALYARTAFSTDVTNSSRG